MRERFPGIVRESLTDSIHGLPKPLAVLAATDYTGIEVCDLARGLGLRVPEEVAVLGVDDFDLLCESCYPPLSSITFPAEKMGFEAARILDQLMRGEAPDLPGPYAPTHVHSRASTELTAVEDTAVARAVAYMREHMREGIRLREIASHVHMHDRTLLRHFQQAIGRSPSEELLRIRLEKAQEMLMNSDAHMYEVSDACGFSSPDVLTRQFRNHTGLRPTEFRDLHRMRG
jgi:LacI family transcriptional regulator